MSTCGLMKLTSSSSNCKLNEFIVKLFILFQINFNQSGLNPERQ